MVTEDQLEETTATIRDTKKHSKVNIHPNERPQTDFIAAAEKDVQKGGAAAGVLRPRMSWERPSYRRVNLRDLRHRLKQWWCGSIVRGN